LRGPLRPAFSSCDGVSVIEANSADTRRGNGRDGRPGRVTEGDVSRQPQAANIERAGFAVLGVVIKAIDDAGAGVGANGLNVTPDAQLVVQRSQSSE
jgi:hypothetical protein